MLKQLIFLLTFICLFLACEDIFKDSKPVISDEGIQLSSDTVYPADTVKAWVSASNPSKGPLEYKWSERRGRGVFAGAKDRDTVRWYATKGGNNYNLIIKVTNDKGSASTDRDIKVISPENPLVNITSPKENEYFVLSQNVEIKVIADHVNGIASVHFYANDSLAAQVSGNLIGTYEFDLKLDRPEFVGKTVIKVEAESASATTGSDEITIDVGGIIQGKHGN